MITRLKPLPFLLLLAAFGAHKLYAEDGAEEKPFIGEYILYFDIKGMYYSTETNTAGLGFGVTLERQILPFLSFRAEGANNTMWSFTKDVRTDTITLGFSPLAYPFSRGLDWLYLGFGISTEFLTYRGDDVPKSHERDTVINLTPQIGWKQNLFDYVLLDFFCIYNIEISNTNIPDYAEDLVDNGWEMGVKVKINLSRILRKIFKRKKE